MYQEFGVQQGRYRPSGSRRDHGCEVTGPPVAGILPGQAVGIRAIDESLAQDREVLGANLNDAGALKDIAPGDHV